MERREMNILNLMITLVNVIFGFILFGLLIRFLFRLFDANTEAKITEFVYNSTGPLLDPFRGVFRPDTIEPGNVVEYSSLVAIIFYMLFAWLIIQALVLIDRYMAKQR